MPGKANVIFPGFPGTVGTLRTSLFGTLKHYVLLTYLTTKTLKMIFHDINSCFNTLFIPLSSKILTKIWHLANFKNFLSTRCYMYFGRYGINLCSILYLILHILGHLQNKTIEKTMHHDYF